MSEFYHQFNESLFSGLNQGFSSHAVTVAGTPASDDKGFSQTGDLTGSGTLVVQVTLARGAVPVEGAKVIVSLADRVLANLSTDKSGQTEAISLPAPESSLSQTPGGAIRPYSVYHIRISYPGYYVEEAINVPIFDGINSIQPVALVPLPEGISPDTEILVDESNQGPV
ncbi:MAG: hypothetical protein J6A56_04405 [Clostridia bacterium]|nr:hypothetical protein [Clostridia bacterium]